MKMCFKFYQNRTINEEFDFWGVNGGKRGPDIKNSKKKPYTELWSQPTHTENFSIIAELERV